MAQFSRPDKAGSAPASRVSFVQFPVSKPELSLGDISEYWAPELKLSRDRAQALLEGAFWLGEISIVSGITRLELLKRLVKWMRNCDFPDIVFVTPEGASPPEITELADGYAAIDLRPRVFIPSGHAETWSEASCEGAFKAMAEIPSLEYYPEWSPGFHAMKLTRDVFFRWTAARGWYPTFWKRRNDEAPSPQLKPASGPMIQDELHRVYDIAAQEGEKPPNINEVAAPVQARLREIGHTASTAQIKGIAERPEFKKRRRPAGKTVKSEKRGPRSRAPRARF
jgi:hypothetical protein